MRQHLTSSIARGLLGMALLPGTASLATVAMARPTSSHVLRVTAITRVLGEGQRLVAVVLDYDRPLRGTSVSKASFQVPGRTILRIYTSASPVALTPAPNGRFVVIELSPDDAAADLTIPAPHSTTPEPPRFLPRQIFKPASATVRQTGTVMTTQGRRYAPVATPIATSAARDPLVDAFRAFTFKDSATGLSLRYNLFVPKGYDPRKTYPLVLFMHDAGVVSEDTATTLKQGLGAVVWASPEDQAKHPAFVLAPQYDHEAINHGEQSARDLQTTVDLVAAVRAQYHIDGKRLYGTGQSMGGTLLLDMAVKHPDLFAASFVVASQTDPATVAPLAGQKLWIVVSQGDARAYPTENEITARLEAAGTKVVRAVWSGTSSPQAFAADVAAMEQEHAPIHYVALEKGTVVPPGQPDNPGTNHINTWRIAYTIPGIRDWLFRQHK